MRIADHTRVYQARQQHKRHRHAPFSPIEPSSGRHDDRAEPRPSAARRCTMGPAGTLAPARRARHTVPTMVRRRRRSDRALPTSTLAPRTHVRRSTAHGAPPPRAPRAHRARPSRHLPRRPLPHRRHHPQLAPSRRPARRSRRTRRGRLAWIWRAGAPGGTERWGGIIGGGGVARRCEVRLEGVAWGGREGNIEGLRWRGYGESGVRPSIRPSIVRRLHFRYFLLSFWSPSRGAHCAVHAFCTTYFYTFFLSFCLPNDLTRLYYSIELPYCIILPLAVSSVGTFI
jgi:hypothetical protein